MEDDKNVNSKSKSDYESDEKKNEKEVAILSSIKKQELYLSHLFETSSIAVAEYAKLLTIVITTSIAITIGAICYLVNKEPILEREFIIIIETLIILFLLLVTLFFNIYSYKKSKEVLVLRIQKVLKEENDSVIKSSFSIQRISEIMLILSLSYGIKVFIQYVIYKLY